MSFFGFQVGIVNFSKENGPHVDQRENPDPSTVELHRHFKVNSNMQCKLVFVCRNFLM